MAERGQRLANCMRRLNNTLRGLPPAQASKVARACGVATVMYAAEAWWPGDTRVSASVRNKVVSTNKGYLEDILDTPLKSLVRAVTPAFKYSPLAALWRETGVLPAKVWMQVDALRASARWATLPAQHPVVERLVPSQPRSERYLPPPPTRLQTRAAMAETPPRPVPLTEPTLRRETVDNKEQSKELYLRQLASLPTTTRLVYTDGSKQGDQLGWAGHGWRGTRGRQYQPGWSRDP